MKKVFTMSMLICFTFCSLAQPSEVDIGNVFVARLFYEHSKSSSKVSSDTAIVFQAVKIKNMGNNLVTCLHSVLPIFDNKTNEIIVLHNNNNISIKVKLYSLDIKNDLAILIPLTKSDSNKLKEIEGFPILEDETFKMLEKETAITGKYIYYVGKRKKKHDGGEVAFSCNKQLRDILYDVNSSFLSRGSPDSLSNVISYNGVLENGASGSPILYYHNGVYNLIGIHNGTSVGVERQKNNKAWAISFQNRLDFKNWIENDNLIIPISKLLSDSKLNQSLQSSKEAISRGDPSECGEFSKHLIEKFNQCASIILEYDPDYVHIKSCLMGQLKSYFIYDNEVKAYSEKVKVKKKLEKNNPLLYNYVKAYYLNNLYNGGSTGIRVLNDAVKDLKNLIVNGGANGISNRKEYEHLYTKSIELLNKIEGKEIIKDYINKARKELYAQNLIEAETQINNALDIANSDFDIELLMLRDSIYKNLSKKHIDDGSTHELECNKDKAIISYIYSLKYEPENDSIKSRIKLLKEKIVAEKDSIVKENEKLKQKAEDEYIETQESFLTAFIENMFDSLNLYFNNISGNPEFRLDDIRISIKKRNISFKVEFGATASGDVSYANIQHLHYNYPPGRYGMPYYDGADMVCEFACNSLRYMLSVLSNEEYFKEIKTISLSATGMADGIPFSKPFKPERDIPIYKIKEMENYDSDNERLAYARGAYAVEKVMENFPPKYKQKLKVINVIPKTTIQKDDYGKYRKVVLDWELQF